MDLSKSLIEVQFPVSRISKESYKERKAGQSQTLTGLGKWWGRKPLVLVRAALLGLLMPASNDPVKDREIFLKILMMDEEGIWDRKNKPMKDPQIIENLTLSELRKYFEVPLDLFSEGDIEPGKLIKQALKADVSKLKWKPGLSRQQKEQATKLAFNRMSYDARLEYCLRPEETNLKDKIAWEQINSHLNTSATSLPELMQQLGILKFGYVPTVGDCFAGGGSIPFEAARVGLKAYASDLNPLAGLLTWAGLNILSLPDKEIDKLKAFQEKVFDEVCRQVEEWGIEKNEKGWMAKYYLYCTETVCPHCKTKVPMSPGWWVSKKTNTVALLKHNPENNNFDIDIIQNASPQQISEAEKMATVKNDGLWCPKCKNHTLIAVLRHDDIDDNGKVMYGLRRWEADEFLPRPDDVFQERLYAIKYLEKNNRKTWAQFLKKPAPATDATYGTVHYTAPDEYDLQREVKVIALVKERFSDWQEKGFIPDEFVQPGDETSRLQRERGWQYWHQLFNPRQLLLIGLLQERSEALTNDKIKLIISKLGIGTVADYNSKLTRWNSEFDKSNNTFYNQAFNTMLNYPTRGLAAVYSSYVLSLNGSDFHANQIVKIQDARKNINISDYWLTDPPYADAVNYHELTEFFLAWDKKFIEKLFPEWYTDSRRVLAVKGTGQNFNQSMIEIYRNLTLHMPDNGMQVVMFTHKDPAVWADLTMILWSAGLHVTAAWNIATETESGGLKEGNYVKGTVLLVLRKRTSQSSAFIDEVTYEIQEEVKNQIDSMHNLDDKEDPNFNDADFVLAAYAATLKVLTGYQRIGDIDIEYELSKPRDGKTVGPIESIINNAIRVAYDYLIPPSFDSFLWKSLTPEERFYIKGLELEKNNNLQLGAYQEMARGFGVKDFKEILASTKANHVRLKTPAELGSRLYNGTEAFSRSIFRQVLMAIYQSQKENNAQAGKAWLKNEIQPEEYWQKRTLIIEVLRYLSTTEYYDHMEHWKDAAVHAKYLTGLVSSDGV